MDNLDIEKFIKIKCIEKNIKINQLANELNMSRQLMWHHIKKKNKEVLLFLAIIVISIIVNFLFYLIFLFFIGQKLARIINEEMESIKRNL